MYSGGNSTPSAAPAGDKNFFCHQCNRSVTIFISSTDDPICPLCNGGFLEENEDPNPNPSVSIADPLSSLLPLLSASPPRVFMDITPPRFFGSSMQATSTEYPRVGGFDPVSFLHNHLQDLRSNGTQFQFVIENHPSDQPHRMPGNFGDYFLGPGLEQLIQHLAENDPNRYGTPPASKSAVDELPTVKVTKDMLNSEMNQCAVCLEEFEYGIDAKQMPCNHVFHEDCTVRVQCVDTSCPLRTRLKVKEVRRAGMDRGLLRGSKRRGGLVYNFLGRLVDRMTLVLNLVQGQEHLEMRAVAVELILRLDKKIWIECIIAWKLDWKKHLNMYYKKRRFQ